MQIKLISLFVIILLFCRCSTTSFEIIDYYRVYRFAENHTNDSNVLMCKLGAGSDPYIPNVKVIKWNQTHMIVETFSEFYFVDGSKNRLCCLCENLTKGPFDLKQIKQIVDSLNFIPIKQIDVHKYMSTE